MALSARRHTSNRPIPPIGFLGEGDRLDGALDRPGPAHGKAPDLGEHQSAVLQPGAVALLLVGKRVVTVLALEAGAARLLPMLDTAKERLIRRVQPRQHILQDMGVVRTVLWPLSAQCLELGFLLGAAHREATLSPQRDALLQGGVVARATAPQ